MSAHNLVIAIVLEKSWIDFICRINIQYWCWIYNLFDEAEKCSLRWDLADISPRFVPSQIISIFPINRPILHSFCNSRWFFLINSKVHPYNALSQLGSSQFRVVIYNIFLPTKIRVEIVPGRKWNTFNFNEDLLIKMRNQIEIEGLEPDIYL